MLSSDLNEYLMPVNSPIAQNQGQVSAYQFDYQNEAGIISSSKIRNASIGTAQIVAFNFNQGTGGTITLGGVDNGDGVMRVLDAGGTEKVRADNSGITITDGKLTFLNSSGGTSIDSAGIVSTNNFTFAQGTAGTADQSITSVGTAWTDITGASVTLNALRAVNVLLNYSVTGFHHDFDGMGVVRVFDGTTAYGPNISLTGNWEGGIPETFTMSYIQQFSTGTYTLRLQAKQNNNPGTLSLSIGGIANTPAVINYVALGK